MTNSKYIVTEDLEIIKRFLKVAPTKYLLGLHKRSKNPGYWRWPEEWTVLTTSAKWSFGKDENYEIRFKSPEALEMLKTELSTRENIRNSAKPDKRVITCNCCGRKMDLIGRKNGKVIEYVVYDDGDLYPLIPVIRPPHLYLKPFDQGKKKVIEFGCVKCNEKITVEV